MKFEYFKIDYSCFQLFLVFVYIRPLNISAVTNIYLVSTYLNMRDVNILGFVDVFSYHKLFSTPGSRFLTSVRFVPLYRST